jgi:hypothetical protein
MCTHTLICNNYYIYAQVQHSRFAFARKFDARVALTGGSPGGGRCGVGGTFEDCLQSLLGL